MTKKINDSCKKLQILQNKKIYIIAGESSGDNIGASVMEALQVNSSSLGMSVGFFGVGGKNMMANGLNSLFSMSDLSLIGLFEILRHIPNLIARLIQVVDDIKKIKPDVIVTIDSPGFNFRLAKLLKSLNIPIVHIGAPTVWAWKPRRAEKISQYITHLLTLFKFEPPYFTKHGLSTTFMGHPITEKELHNLPKDFLHQEYGISKSIPILCLVPGSREDEIKKHLDIFLDAVEILKVNYRKLLVVIPTLPEFKEQIERLVKVRGVNAFVITDEKHKYLAMKSCTAALAASGTVTLELGIMGIPMVVAYRINKLTAFIVKHMLLTKYVSLVNILLGKKVVTELLQENCTADNCVSELNQLLSIKSQYYKHQKKELLELSDTVTNDTGNSPSYVASKTILEYL